MKSDLAFTKNSIDIKSESIFKLKFKNGPEYEWNSFDLNISGLLEGSSIIKVSGLINIEDKINHLISWVMITKESGMLDGLPKLSNFGGFLWGSKKEEPKEKKKPEKNDF